MMRRTILAVVIGSVVALAAPAMAKGPESATIAGPGLDEPIELGLAQDGEPAALALLMEQSGIWFGIGDLPTAIDGPPADLGEPYTITWVNSGPPGTDVAVRTIVQSLYLDAAGGAVLHTPKQGGLLGWGDGVTGWFAAPPTIEDTLVALGVPTSARFAPDAAAGSTVGWVFAGLAAVVIAGVATAVVWRFRRPQPVAAGRAPVPGSSR